jgi:flagellin
VKAATAIGIVVACVGILGAAMMEGTSPAAFFNIPAMILVFAGTFGGESIAITFGSVDIDDYSDLDNVDLADVDADLDDVSTARAGYGAVQNRLEHALAVTGTYQENLTSAESRIRDVDMAEEMVNLTKNQILQQAGTAMLAQANQAPQAVLQLLR